MPMYPRAVINDNSVSRWRHWIRSRRSATFTPSAHVRRQSLPVWPPTLIITFTFTFYWMPVWSSLIAEQRGADTEWLRRWPRVRAVSFPVTPSCTRALHRWSMVYGTVAFFFFEWSSFLVATSIDVTHVTSRFYKWPPFNVWGAVAHTYLFFFSGRGVNGIAKTINPSIAQDRRRAELHGAMSFVFLRHREVELLPKGNFWSHFLAVSCHRALSKRRYLDSTTSNLENWVLFFPEKGGGCTENERQKWRVDQWRSHTWSGAVGWSHTGVDGARHRCAQWGGDRLVCHQSNTQCTQRVVKKVGQSTNFESLYLGHFLPDLNNSPLIRFLLSCRKRNKSGNSVFRILKKSPEVSISSSSARRDHSCDR